MINVSNLSMKLGAFELARVSFGIRSGAYAILMGKTGTGKTSLLEALCGLRPILGGRIELDGRDVTALRPGERGIGYVPQDTALFGQMTVREHLAFALEVRERPADEIKARVDELAKLLGIAPLLDRKPYGLSGGERQRVALGRALAARPSILCLDEPLSALDEETHGEMVALLRSAQQHEGVTVLHVTHSQREAQALGDLHLYLKDGAVLQNEQ
ncbi:MAG: ATP-binding cassette domain-containing protein [Planctomycetes bacterium]|nr:ATP-binding cassette domain-containing protein [Planctomycetota bacterium]